MPHLNGFWGDCELKANSLITASDSKRFHADTLVAVTGDPAISYAIHLSHVFTAPWEFKISLVTYTAAQCSFT